MADQVAEKVCARCGADVSRSKRTKDKKGRYWCMDCYNQALAARRKQQQQKQQHAGQGEDDDTIPVAAPDNEQQLTAQLIDEAAGYQQNVCPSCRSPMPADAVICTHCGLNRSTNRQAKTRVRKANDKADKGDGPSVSAPDLSGLTNNPAFWFVAGIAGAMLPLIGLASPTLVLPAVLLSGIIALGLVVWVIVAGFQASPLSGVLLLVLAPVPLIGLIYWIYFIFWRNESDLLKMVFGGYVLGSAVVTYMSYSGMLPPVQ